MRAFITTVAGMSTRFSKDLPEAALKCIFYYEKPQNTLLYHMLITAQEYDKLVIVGGFQFNNLQKYINDFIPVSLKEKIMLVENPEYAHYGSGWSLYMGLKALQQTDYIYDEILFAEGDLYVDKESFQSILVSEKDVMTAIYEPIQADKAVAFYFDLAGIPHYIYDTSHGSLNINEPFVSIYNSGQIWKFCNIPLFFSLSEEIGEENHKGTNLTLINTYLAAISKMGVFAEIIYLTKWINCNTISDFNKVKF